MAHDIEMRTSSIFRESSSVTHKYHKCGGGGIRTPDTLRYAGFQDQCIQPDSATPPAQ